MVYPKSALIIARPGQLRSSLQVLLAAIPHIEKVVLADDGPSGLAMVTEHRPTVMLLDCELFYEKLELILGQIKAGGPQTQCLVLVDDEQQHQVAESAGADVVLMKGILASKFYATVEELLLFREG